MDSIKNFLKKINLSKNYLLILFDIALVLAAILLLITFIKSTNQSAHLYSPKIAEPMEISKVDLKGSDGSVESVKLPVKRDSRYSYSYNFVVEKDINEMEQCVNVNVYYTSFIIRYKGEVIYEKSISKNPIVPSMAASFNVIDIPNRLIGKELEIEFVSNLPNSRALKIPKILIGTKTQIKKHYFYKELFSILAGIALFITAIFISIIGLFFITIGQSSRNLFIAVLFTIIMSLYVIFKSWIILDYLGNSVLAYFIEYTCLILTPVPIFLFFLNVFYENNYYDWRTKTFEYFVVIIFINLIVQWVFTLTGLSEFVLMEKTSLAILAISILYITVAVITLDKNKIEVKNYLIFSILPLVIFIIATTVTYYQTYDVQMMPLIIISVILLIATHFSLSLKKYVFEYNLAIENEFYSQLAYFDTLTQLSNRHDFEKTLESIVSKDVTFNNMYLIMLDMNNLKEINDNYGHKTGDAYLKAAGKLLLRIETKYGNLKAYRYGGDEFIILAYNKKQRELEKIISDINSLSNIKIVSECEYNLEFALGYSLCSDQDSFEILDIKEQADKNMYEDKAHKKEAKADDK